MQCLEGYSVNEAQERGEVQRAEETLMQATTSEVVEGQQKRAKEGSKKKGPREDEMGIGNLIVASRVETREDGGVESEIVDGSGLAGERGYDHGYGFESGDGNVHNCIEHGPLTARRQACKGQRWAPERAWFEHG